MTRRFLDTSNSHLSPDTCTWLDLQFSDGTLRDPHNITAAQLGGGRTRYGWFVYAIDHPAVDIPADLARVLAEARKQKADYVLFDCDAPPNGNLPVLQPNVPTTG